jgi:hypothetical protein
MSAFEYLAARILFGRSNIRTGLRARRPTTALTEWRGGNFSRFCCQTFLKNPGLALLLPAFKALCLLSSGEVARLNDRARVNRCASFVSTVRTLIGSKSGL